jgi:UDP-glucuronate 4-epimerase
MKIIVTGSAGFIGSHLCTRLLAEQHHVIGIDNYNSDIYDNNHKYKNVATNKEHPNYTDVRSDILDYDFASAETAASSMTAASSVTAATDRTAVDVIVHLAGYANVRQSFLYPERFVRNNVECTTKILNDITKQSRHPIPLFIYASSSSVYGTNTTVPFTETDELSNIVSPYAATKKMCEDLVEVYAKTKQVNAIGLRFFTVYGPGGRPDMAIYNFLQNMIDNRPITVYGDGSMRRDYTYIDDIVDGICRCIGSRTAGSAAAGATTGLTAAGATHTIYNLGTGQPITLQKLISVCEETTGVRANIVYVDTPLGDVPTTYANISKAKTELGFAPKVSIEDGIGRCYRSMCTM